MTKSQKPMPIHSSLTTACLGVALLHHLRARTLRKEKKEKSWPLGVMLGASVSRSSPDRKTAFAFVISRNDFARDVCGFDTSLGSAAFCSSASSYMLRTTMQLMTCSGKFPVHSFQLELVGSDKPDCSGVVLYIQKLRFALAAPISPRCDTLMCACWPANWQIMKRIAVCSSHTS